MHYHGCSNDETRINILEGATVAFSKKRYGERTRERSSSFFLVLFFFYHRLYVWVQWRSPSARSADAPHLNFIAHRPIVVASILYHRDAQATKGEPCTENQLRKRTRCIHTQLVAVALWTKEGKGDEGIDIGQGTGGGDGDGDGQGDDQDDGSSERTAQKMLKADPSNPVEWESSVARRPPKLLRPCGGTE